MQTCKKESPPSPNNNNNNNNNSTHSKMDVFNNNIYNKKIHEA
jgi:hypothetical protein